MQLIMDIHGESDSRGVILNALVTVLNPNGGLTATDTVLHLGCMISSHEEARESGNRDRGDVDGMVVVEALVATLPDRYATLNATMSVCRSVR